MQEYIDKKKEIQKEILSLFSSDQNGDSVDFSNFLKLIKDQKILEDENEIRSLLHLICAISNNHYRSPNFFGIIEKILLLFKDDLQKHLTNQEIIFIFKDNNRIILMLLENKIIELNQLIKDSKYFAKEIKPSQKKNPSKDTEDTKESDDDELFEKKRRIGENGHKICEIIRNDKIDDFITYTQTNNISFDYKIPSSIYETNLYLKNKEPTLIEYSAFYGSIQIFNYLQSKGALLTPSIWPYVVHGRNLDMINALETYLIIPEKGSYRNVYIKALLCHHNEIANYIKDKYLQEKKVSLYYIVSSYNYECFPECRTFDKKAFCYFCHFDYFYFVTTMLDTTIINAEYKEYIIDDYEMYYTPFLAAALNNNINIIKILIDRPEIDINTKAIRIEKQEEYDEINALRIAIFNYNNDLAQLLLNHKRINVNSKITVRKVIDNFFFDEIVPMFSIAISYRDINMVNLFLQHSKIDVNEKYQDSLSYCTEDEAYQTADITPLIMSCKINDIEMVKLVLSHPNLDINSISTIISEDLWYLNGSALCYSIDNNQIEITKLLLKHPKIDVNSKYVLIKNNSLRKEKPALYLAIEKENEEIVKELLKFKEININSKYYSIDNEESKHEEKSILQIAFEKGNENIIKLLLSNSEIDVNAKSFIKTKFESEEKTFSYAINYGNVEIMNILLKNPELNIKMKNIKITCKSDSHECEEKNILEIVDKNPEMFNLLLNHLKQLYENSDDKLINEIISKYS